MFMKVVMVVLPMVITVAAAQAKPGCPNRCGNVTIPYPFGTSYDCNISREFLITCNDTFYPPTPFLGNGNLPVLDISLNEGQLRINPRVFRSCYNSDGEDRSGWSKLWLEKFTISSTKNKFTAVGCDTRAVIEGTIRRRGDKRFYMGCLSYCFDSEDIVNGSCSGIGCCEAAIPNNVNRYRFTLQSYYNYSYVSNFSKCGFVFIAEDGSFNFSYLDLNNLRDVDRLPVVLDWSIGNQTCDQAKINPASYACKENSYCSDSQNGGVGYLCHCLQGFEGNPYLHGCIDIDECRTSIHNCSGTCFNTVGAYNCSCPPGYHGNGWSNGTGCSIQPHPNKFNVAIIVLGTIISILALLLGISWLQMGLRQRKLQKLRQKFFEQNGGILFNQELAKYEGISSEAKAQIFTEEELKKATKNYHESRILGRGGQGIVYKGFLTDNNRIVAIKKARIWDQSQVQEFVNEVIVVSQINHRNVVKLLGCCLETEVPLLVYEFVPNGTLFHHVHSTNGSSFLPWKTRLKIATEAVGALSYLHSSASTPIIHRDIKSTNILLDYDYTAKIADFGTSRLIPLDKTKLTTLVQGTLGYLDPEYMQSSQLTDKSDVYSFGVVLIELLTGEKAFSFQKPEQEKNLAMYFVSTIKEDRFFNVIDRRLLNRSDIHQLKEVAMLAIKCVRVKGEERPTMKEVAYKLERLRARGGRSSLEVDYSHIEENESSLSFDGKGGNTSISTGTSTNTTRYDYDSLKYMEIEGGR